MITYRLPSLVACVRARWVATSPAMRRLSLMHPAHMRAWQTYGQAWANVLGR